MSVPGPMGVLHWIVVSAGMVPPEVWQGFTLIAAMLIMNYVYGDSVALLF